MQIDYTYRKHVKYNEIAHSWKMLKYKSCLTPFVGKWGLNRIVQLVQFVQMNFLCPASAGSGMSTTCLLNLRLF